MIRQTAAEHPIHETGITHDRRPTATRLRTRKTALTLLVGAIAFGCSSDPAEHSSPPTAEKVSSLTGTLPAPVGWWSFDELTSSTSVYDSQPLPAVASGTKYNSVSAVEGKVGRGLSFNGTNQYVNIPNKTAYQMSSAVTISAWAQPAAGTAGTIAGKWGTQNSYRLLVSSGKFAFSVTLSSGTVVTATASATASTTAWSHVAGVFNGSTAILYVNGVQAASASASGTLKSSTDPIRVGNTTNNANYYKGTVDELRLHSSALTGAQVNRIANGLQHRRLRAVAVDPKFVTDPTYAGKRLHEHPTFAANGGWRTPDAVVQYWMDFLNAAAGERVYLPEDGSYASAVKYVEEVPWNNNAKVNGCELGQGNSPVIQSADQYLARVQANGTGNPGNLQGDPFRIVKTYNSSLGFDLVADANGQLFHELMVICPPDWGINGEGWMAASPTDTTAYMTHDGVFRMSGLANNRKFSTHGVAFSRDDRNYEQYFHRAEAMLVKNWSTDMGNPCSVPWLAGYAPLGSMATLRHAVDLFMLGDYGFNSQGQVGNAHFMPNTSVGYVRNHNDRVPSAYSYWSTFPADYPYDLTRIDRRVPVSCDAWACTGDSVDRSAWIWQMSKLPKTEGTTDGRSNNWWMYITDPNYQLGRGVATAPPVMGPSQGGLDFTLTVYSDRIGLKWMTESTGKGTYTVQRSTDRSTWTNVTSVTGSTATYDISPRPTNAVDTFYRVAWNDGTITRYSDQLGVNLGTATPINVSAGQRPPVNPSISLLQQGNPYVRWELPTSCGLGNTVANSPCNASYCSGPCMKCVANECRAGSDGSGDLYSDYHLGVTRYFLEKREASYSSVWTVDRRPGWEGQYNHLQFSSADNAVASNTVVGYRVSAYQMNGDGTQGATWGHTDVLLAVPGNATLGTTGSGGTGGTGGTSSTGGSGGKATGGATGSGGSSTGGKASGGTSSTGGTASGSGGTSSSGGSGGSGTNPCASLCSNPVVFTTPSYQSGNLGTGAICRETTANLSGGNCSNMSSRTLTVNGTAMNCTGWTLPAKRNGGYCIQVTAGSPDYASFATW
jgi:hypothetical protein